jgi:hypothetical protein
MNKGSKKNGLRALKRKWLNESIEHRIEWEFRRLDEVQKRFPKGKLRVADCPVSGKPVLQGFMLTNAKETVKQWHCIHENKTFHNLKNYPAIEVKIYEKEKEDA